MSVEIVRELLGRAVLDPGFRGWLFKQPEQALAGYSLTVEELAFIQELSIEDLYAQIGRIAACQLLPIRIGKRLVIAPDWLNLTLSPGDLLIRLHQQKTSAGINRDGRPVEWDGTPVSLDIPLAFGSGLHPTTCLCLEALEDHLSGGETVLDLGTGSGILAIAAAKLGATRVLALDTDAAAVQIAHEHAVLNQVEQIVQVALGSLECLQVPMSGETSFMAHLVVANLVASGIQSAFQAGLAEVLMPGSWMILSGFRSSDLVEIEQAVEAAGLGLITQKQLEDWCAIISRRLSSGS